ncbi:hypothetical protein [Methylomonas sp. AM2-LC]|uniref:hypothetical protein n=1 Tax=Methylomonas sp. AM2-LC TaxID=3153301 RepID=UPI0032631563
MRQIDRDSDEWHKVWQSLDAALNETLLPGQCGQKIKCSLNDFMLMGVNLQERVGFKDIHTRCYLFLLPDGSIETPSGGMWYAGEFSGDTITENPVN